MQGHSQGQIDPAPATQAVGGHLHAAGNRGKSSFTQQRFQNDSRGQSHAQEKIEKMEKEAARTTRERREDLSQLQHAIARRVACHEAEGKVVMQETQLLATVKA